MTGLDHYKQKQYTVQFHDVCSKFVDQREQAKIQCLLDLTQIITDTQTILSVQFNCVKITAQKTELNVLWHSTGFPSTLSVFLSVLLNALR
jgi:hypothetical protein